MAPETEENTGRRSFLKTINILIGGTLAAVAAIPGIGYLLHPLCKDSITFKSQESRLGLINSFKVGTPKKITISAGRRDAWLTTPAVTVGSVWVIRTQEEPAEFTVLSTVCPHLGCPISHQKKGFLCPCHSSTFSAQGERIEANGKSSPSPRNMDSIPHRIDDGVLLCSYKKFRIGATHKIAMES